MCTHTSPPPPRLNQRSGLSGVCGTQEVLPGGALLKTTGEGFCSLSVPLVRLSDPHLLCENHFRDAACFTNQLPRLFSRKFVFWKLYIQNLLFKKKIPHFLFCVEF